VRRDVADAQLAKQRQEGIAQGDGAGGVNIGIVVQPHLPPGSPYGVTPKTGNTA
jgi:hypothetical protein